MTRTPATRRGVLRYLFGAPLSAVQSARTEIKRQRPPLAELITALEFEEVAKTVLAPPVFATIAGSDRAAFDRIMLRPRMCIPTVDLDLTAEIFGEKHFTPILVGPVGVQQQFHQDGERATVRGAGAAKAAVVISSKSSVPIAELARDAKTPLWYATYADAKGQSVDHLQQAVSAGCKVVCVTAATSGRNGGAIAREEWAAIDRVRTQVTVPLVIKGVRSSQDAATAVAHGANGIIVSNHGGATGVATIDALSPIVEAVGSKVVVLVDGNFRRGTDMLKALILGARGVLVSRPVMWGLASYGADGVQAVLELLQNDLGRHVAAIGAPNLESLTPTFVKVHHQQRL